jgi:outer membrane protein assembly factor BamB
MGFCYWREVYTPAIGADGTIYFGDVDHNLYALNPDGTLKSAFPTGFTISSPAIGRGRYTLHWLG